MSAEVLEDLDLTDYHADKVGDVPSLSSSIAKIILDRSPLHAYHAHPRLGGHPVKATAVMDRGTLIHRLVLGRGAELAIIEAKDWRTKVAKEARAAAVKDGRLPVLVGAYVGAQRVAKRIIEELGKLGVRLTGKSEVAITWEELGYQSKPVRCRGCLDHVVGDRIYDLKLGDAKPEGLGKRALDLGWAVQGAAYESGAGRVWPELAGRWRYTVIAAEPEEPHAVFVGELDGMLRAFGQKKWSEAVERWSHALATKTWAGYADADDRRRIEAPPWMAARMEQDA